MTVHQFPSPVPGDREPLDEPWPDGLATESTWTPQDPESVVEANLQWIDDLADALAPHVSSSAYQNFIDRSQPDWQQAYYGRNFERLTEVKRRYDPENVFNQNFPITPAAVGAAA